MIALRNLKRVINIRLYNTCSENMSSLAQEPLYELNSPIQIDTFGNKMTYFRELKKLSHYIDTSNQIFAYHPKEHVYEYIAFWDQDMHCLLYTSPTPRDGLISRMPSSA